MGITIAGFDLTSQENLLIIANLVLILIAVFLLIRLRLAYKKNQPEKEKQTGLAGIADLKPEDLKLDRFDLNKEILQQEKSDVKPFDAGLESKIQPPAINVNRDAIMENLVSKTDKTNVEQRTESPAISITNDVKSDNPLMQIEELNHGTPIETGTVEEMDELSENTDTISIEVQSVTPEINELRLEDDSPEETIVIQSEDVTSGVETQDKVKIETNALETDQKDMIDEGTKHKEDTTRTTEQIDTPEPITLIEETSKTTQSESLLTSSEKVPEIITSNIVKTEANKFENPPAALEAESNVTNPGNTGKAKKKVAKKKKPGRKKKVSAEETAGPDAPAKVEKPKKKASKRESLF